jgi:DnaJ-class molecular chaperone
MQPHLTEPCKTCDGTGLVARARRTLPNGEPDRLDRIEWPQAICETCNGSGRVPLDHSQIAETAAA